MKDLTDHHIEFYLFLCMHSSESGLINLESEASRPLLGQAIINYDLINDLQDAGWLQHSIMFLLTWDFFWYVNLNTGDGEWY